LILSMRSGVYTQGVVMCHPFASMMMAVPISSTARARFGVSAGAKRTAHRVRLLKSGWRLLPTPIP
jgi:hypothetical protein